MSHNPDFQKDEILAHKKRELEKSIADAQAFATNDRELRKQRIVPRLMEAPAPAVSTDELERLVAHVRGGGPHEWGYRDLTDGTFIADDWPFDAAAFLSRIRGEGEVSQKQQDKGASDKSDRATHEQSPQAVSAVPVGIPGACCCGKCLECDAAGYHLDEAIRTFGQRLRARRRLMDLTLDQLAERSGMSKSYLCEIEGGKNKNPTIRTALLLCRALGWTLSECIGLYEHASLLHPDAMRIAGEIDILLRSKSAEVAQ